jgi:hypothetical protein
VGWQLYPRIAAALKISLKGETKMADEYSVDYGFGTVPKLPVPARERPDTVDPTPTYILPGGDKVLAKTIDQQRAEASTSTWAVSDVRVRAAKLEYPNKHVHTPRPVLIKMPNFAKPILLGGEALVQALANGGQPVE